MNGKYFFTPAIAILAIALVGYAEASKNTGVVSVGPIMPPVSTPRVRVSNDGMTPIHVSFASNDGVGLVALGSVPAFATRTLTIPAAVRDMYVVVERNRRDGERFISEGIAVQRTTDVSLRVGDRLERSTVLVGDVVVKRR